MSLMSSWVNSALSTREEMSMCQSGNPSLSARHADPRGKRGRCHAPNAEQCHVYPTKIRQRGWPKGLLSVDLLVGRRRGLQKRRAGVISLWKFRFG